MEKFICEICKKELKTLRGIGTHTLQVHNISSKDYYDLYLRK
jgi:hypothetical protein